MEKEILFRVEDISIGLGNLLDLGVYVLNYEKKELKSAQPSREVENSIKRIKGRTKVSFEELKECGELIKEKIESITQANEGGKVYAKLNEYVSEQTNSGTGVSEYKITKILGDIKIEGLGGSQGVGIARSIAERGIGTLKQYFSVILIYLQKEVNSNGCYNVKKLDKALLKSIYTQLKEEKVYEENLKELEEAIKGGEMLRVKVYNELKEAYTEKILGEKGVVISLNKEEGAGLRRIIGHILANIEGEEVKEYLRGLVRKGEVTVEDRMILEGYANKIVDIEEQANEVIYLTMPEVGDRTIVRRAVECYDYINTLDNEELSRILSQKEYGIIRNIQKTLRVSTKQLRHLMYITLYLEVNYDVKGVKDIALLKQVLAKKTKGVAKAFIENLPENEEDLDLDEKILLKKMREVLL